MPFIEETRIIFDKSAIQGLNINKLEKYITSPYKSLITRELQIECLGNLTKSDPKYEKKLKARHITKETFTSQHFSKIKIFPLARYNYVTLMKKELLNNVYIIQKHDFFNYGVRRSTQENFDIFEHNNAKDEVEFWASGKFSENDYAIAKNYNKGLQEKREEFDREKDRNYLSINQILGLANAKPIPSLIKKYLNKILNLDIDGRIRLHEEYSLSEIAPYSAYVCTVMCLFHNYYLPQWYNNLSSKITSNWIDFNYTYYFPFIDQFISDDDIFENFIENFLNGKIIVVKNKKN